jgi:hypothetical protein
MQVKIQATDKKSQNVLGASLMHSGRDVTKQKTLETKIRVA